MQTPEQADSEPDDEARRIAEEQQIILAVQDGQVEAFGQLYSLHEPTIQRWFRRNTSDGYLAEELKQDTFEKALRRINQLTDISRGASSWLHAIARNTLRDHARRAHIFRFGPLDETKSEQAAITNVPEPGFEITETKHDLAPYVARILGGMNKIFADAIIAVDRDDLSYEEAAERLGTIPGTIRSRLHRGRKIFKMLGSQLPEDYGHLASPPSDPPDLVEDADGAGSH